MSDATNTTEKADAGQNSATHFTARDIGIVIDESCGSADDLNTRTISLAEEYGFKNGLLSGCFDGLRGLCIEMTYDDAESASHSGDCSDAAEWLAGQPKIATQLDSIGPDAIRDGLRESGAWNADELADDAQNRVRAVWFAACDARENASEQWSEIADDAVSFLNDLDMPPYCSFYFEDNSLFLAPCLESVREYVEFISSKERDYPDDDFQGEWLHVSDHGNATLYVRENGQDRELWSIV